MKDKLLTWIPIVPVAAILAMTGVMKLVSNPDSVAIFEKLGGAPAMYFAGIVEVAAAVALLVPKARLYGALASIGTMVGAIGAHIAVLEDDSMLPVAVVVLVLSAFVAFRQRGDAPFGIGARLAAV